MFNALGKLFQAIASLLTAVNTTANTARIKSAEMSKNVREKSGLTKEQIREEENFFED